MHPYAIKFNSSEGDQLSCKIFGWGLTVTRDLMILASVAHPRLSTNSMLLLSIPSRATSSLKNRLFSFTIYDNCLRMIWNKIATSTHNWLCTWQTCHRVCPHPEFQIWLQEDLLPVMKYNFDLCLKWNISGYGMGGSQMQPYSFISLYSPLFHLFSGCLFRKCLHEAYTLSWGKIGMLFSSVVSLFNFNLIVKQELSI